MVIVLKACAKPDRNVTWVTCRIVQLSFLPIERTGNQWLGITACNKLSKILPINIWFILLLKIRFDYANVFAIKKCEQIICPHFLSICNQNLFYTIAANAIKDESITTHFQQLSLFIFV